MHFGVCNNSDYRNKLILSYFILASVMTKSCLFNIFSICIYAPF